MPSAEQEYKQRHDSSSVHNQQQACESSDQAVSPLHIPPRGWLHTLCRVKTQFSDDNLNIVAPGVAFLMLLALFPAMVAIISLYSLALDPQEVRQQIGNLSDVFPAEALDFMQSQLNNLVSGGNSTLSWGALVSILIAVYSAMRGMAALVSALNIVYGETEQRSAGKLALLNSVMAVGAMIFGMSSLTLVAILPALAQAIGLTGTDQSVTFLRWPLLTVMIFAGLAMLYHYGPCRKRPKWRWVIPGALLASLFFILISAVFSWYVSNFSRYNQLYGSVGGVVVLMSWLLFTAYTVLIGAELNAELERQTEAGTQIDS